jgi:hypothetical protein
MRFPAAGLVVLFASGAAAAQPADPGAAPVSTSSSTTAATSPAPAAPAPPYSLPWQMRPASIGNVVRSDSSIAFYKGSDPARAGTEVSGSTIASTLAATYKITPTLAPLVRVGVVQNSDPNPAAGSGAAFMNPVVGLLGAWKLPSDLRLSALLAAALPLGTGGAAPPAGDGSAAAINRGIGARSAFDNAMFAVNYFTPLLGADLAWVAHKLTVQAEVTVFQLLRVRNENCSNGTTKCAADSMRTNATGGLHLGYFVIPMLSLGGELRYQRYLSTPAAVKANPAARDSLTVAVGPRLHIKMGDNVWLRPGLSYATALDQPLKSSKYNIVQVDLPVVF